MPTPKDPWHYPRADLAHRHFALLEGGLANALVMFGRRRTGKTEFLLKDLAPVAEKAKWTVVYVNFWASPLAPDLVLVRALESALNGAPLGQRLMDTARRATARITLGGRIPGVDAGASMEFAPAAGPAATDKHLQIDELLGRLVRGGRRALLLFDEVQELATDPANAGLIAALRAGLDTRKSQAAAVFTGSNRDGLNAMFARRAAPFFQFATPIALPDLGEPFVDHLLATFRTVTGTPLPRDEVLTAFHDAHRSPFFLRKLLELVALDPDRNVARGAVELRLRLASDLGYDRLWLEITPLQRAVLAHLAAGGGALFSEATRTSIAQAIGGPTPTTSQLQAALRRLTRLKLVARLDGRADYILDDPEFGTWIAASLVR